MTREIVTAIMCVDDRNTNTIVLRFIRPDGDYVAVKMEKETAAKLVKLLLDKLIEKIS